MTTPAPLTTELLDELERLREESMSSGGHYLLGGGSADQRYLRCLLERAPALISAARASLESRGELETIAARVHQNWIASKRAIGVTSRKSESGEELMAPYELLSEPAKELDRVTVRAVLWAMGEVPSTPPPPAEGAETMAGWAVRVLDADAIKHGTNVPQVQRGLRDKAGKREWTLFLSIEGGRVPYTAASPEAARIAAAQALYAADPSLPAPPEPPHAR